HQLLTKKDLHLIEKNQERVNFLSQNGFESIFPEIEEGIRNTDIIILAVKPQDFQTVGEKISTTIEPNQILLSIMAGITISKIATITKHESIIRAMPNTPAILGLGMTAFCCSSTIDQKQKEAIKKLIETTGKTIILDDENLIDGVTAISGSGPAYFYYFIKAMVEAGEKMGIDKEIGLQLATQTMLGAHQLIENSDGNLNNLISMVTSKGGTTIAALECFETNNVGEGIQKGMKACHNRAKELSA
nr:pyrroline-5-carboxylate reductase [Pseudarcicella sp.]